MKPNFRSLSGVVLMLAIIPIFASLLACMPVPIGDPERSRIDPAISGVWLLETGDDFDAMYLFRPYDKRTWLVLGAGLEEGSDYAGEPFDLSTTEDAIKLLRELPIGQEGITSTGTIAFKVWRKKLGGVWFMTWEQVGGFHDDGSFKPEYWYVFRLDKTNRDSFSLRLVTPEHEAFADIVEPDDYEGDDYVKDMRHAWERAIKRVVDDPELYVDEDEAWVFTRVPDDLLDKASELFQEVIEFE